LRPLRLPAGRQGLWISFFRQSLQVKFVIFVPAMKRSLIIILVAAAILSGCKKDNSPATSGTVKIDNTLYGTGPYYAKGFSFSSAGLVSTLETPGPDIVLYVNADNPASARLTFQANNFTPSFYKLGDYPDAASAISAFNNLKTVGSYQWTAMADPVSINQVWVYRSGTETYAKIRIVSTVNEKRNNLAFGECTFEWVFQPDGSLTFPGK
jgi:hypothetical protein